MSLKLFNGYSIRSCDIFELNEFYKELRKRYTSYIFKEYQKLLASQIDSIAKDLYIKKYKVDKAITEEKLRKEAQSALDFTLISLYDKAKPIIPNIKKVVGSLTDIDSLEEENSIEYVKNYFSSCFGNLLTVAEDIISNKFELGQITKQSNPLFDFSGELCVFPNKQLEDRILLLAYGSRFEKYLQAIINKEPSALKRDIDFFSKFSLEYYPYWNNVDIPEDVSEEDWEKRKKEWDLVFEESDIPSNNGFVFECFNKENGLSNFEAELFEDKSYLYSQMETQHEKLKHMAETIIKENFFDSYFKSHYPGESYSYSIEREINKAYKSYQETYDYRSLKNEFISRFKEKNIESGKNLLSRKHLLDINILELIK